jgi:hypothetical protein
VVAQLVLGTLLLWVASVLGLGGFALHVFRVADFTAACNKRVFGFNNIAIFGSAFVNPQTLFG